MFCALGILTAGATTVTQSLSNDIGLPAGAANVPTAVAGTTYTASDTGIKYTIYGCYTNSGYLMLNGKAYEGAYISYSLDFN